MKTSGAREARRPSAVGTMAMVIGGGLAGFALAALDLGLPHEDAAPFLDRACAAALLPGMGAILGGLAGILPSALYPFLLAALVGEGARRAGLGARARTLPLAPLWPYLGAAGTLVAAVLAPKRPGRLRFLLGALSLGGWTFAALVQRGRYHALREIALLLALLGLGRAFAWAPRARLLRIGLIAVCLAALLLGGLALRQDRGGDWVQGSSRAVLAAWWRLRPIVAARPEASTPKSRDIARPFFDTALDRRSRELFAGVEGVLWVTIDALRADAVGPMADRPSDTPHFDSLAARGRRFDRAYTNCPISQPAVFSALSGLLPSRIVADPAGFQGVPLVTTILARRGVHTRGAFPEGMLTVREEGFDRRRLDFQETTGHRWHDLEPEALARALLPEGEGPWFAWAHLMRPHHPYVDAAPVHREGLDMKVEKEAWRAEVRHADADLGALIAALDAAGRLEETLVIVTADHGEAFGEHGGHRHGSQLFEETLRVPFAVAGPGVAAGADPRCISLVDLAPTFAQLYGFSAEERAPYQGRSLLPLFAGLEDPDRPLEVVAEIPPLPSGLYEVASALVAPTSKLIVHERLRRETWFDLRRDPGETRNRARSEPRALAAARRRLRARQTSAGAVSAETFAAASAVRVLRERGDLLPPNELYEFLRHRPELEEDELLRWLVQVARMGHATLAGGLGETWADDPRPRVQRVARILRGMATSTPAERKALDQLAMTATHPEVLTAHYVFAQVKRHPGLQELRAPQALAPALAHARYRLDLFGEQPAADLLRRGLAATTPHVHRRAALRLAARAGHRPDLAWLRQLIENSEDDQIRIESIAACAPHRGDPRAYRWLRDRLDRGSRAEQEALFEELLLHPAAAEDFEICAWLRPTDRESMRGLEPFDATTGRLAAHDASCPITLFPEGTHVALFLHLEDIDFRRNRVRVSIGNFKTDVIETSRDPTKPRVFWLPPGTRAERVEMSVLAGDPATMRFAGVATRAARREPPRRFGVRAY